MRTGISPQSPVSQVFREQPASLEVFISFHMACVGCKMSKFCTIDEAARAHHIPLKELVMRLTDVESTLQNQEMS